MLQFFRKEFRIKSFGDRNLKKYFLYTLGEIMLIVISISAAWKINDWNSIRIDRINQFQILSDLSKDFNANIIALDSAIALYPESTQRLKSTLNYVGLDPDLLSEQMKDTIINAEHVHTELITGSINTVLKSDILETITKDSLVALMSAYPAHVAVFKSHEEELEHIIMYNHRPILERYLSLSDIFSDEDPIFKAVKANGVKSDYQKLLKSLEYQNVLVDRLNMEDKLLQSARQLKSKTKEVTEMLNREIGSHEVVLRR